MSERIAKIILETEVKTSGNIAPTVQQINDLQKAAQAAQGDTLKLVEAEKKLASAAAQAGVQVEQITKKQSEFNKSANEGAKAINQMVQSQKLATLSPFVETKKDASELVAIIDKYKKSLQEAKTLSDAEGARRQFGSDIISAGGPSAFNVSQQEFTDLDASAYDEYNNAIKRVSISVKEFTEANSTLVDGLNEKVGSLTKQLRDLRAQAQATEDPVLFNKLTTEAGELQDRITSTNEVIKALSSSTFFADTLVEGAETAVSAFTALQGIMSFVVEDEKELAIAAQKAQGALAILAGTQKLLSDLKKGDNIITRAQIVLQRTYAVAVGQSTGAMRVFRSILFGLGIGAVVAAIALLVENWDKLSSALGNSTKQAQKAIEAQRQLAQATLEASNAALTASNSFNDYLKSTGQSEEQIIRNRIESLNRYVGEQNDLDKSLTEGLRIENLQRRKLNQEQVDAESKIRDEARKNAAQGLIERGNAENQLIQLITNSNNKAQDLRLRELNERERHTLSLAQLDYASTEELLGIQLDYAQQRLAILRTMDGVDKVQIQQAKNNVTEINRTLNNLVDGSISQLQEKVNRIRSLAFSAFRQGSEDFLRLADEFKIANKELTEASKAFDLTEAFTPGSLNALNQQANELKSIIDNLAEDSPELIQKRDELIALRKEIERLEKVIAGPAPRDLQGLLDAEERYYSESLEIAEATESEKLALAIRYQKERLELLRGEGAAEVELVSAENELDLLEKRYDKALQVQKDKNKEFVQQQIESFMQLIDAAAYAAQTILDIRMDENEQLADLQRQRIDDLKSVADRGNSEMLQAEQKKLDAINEQNKKFANAQLAINQIMLISNTAVAVAKAAAEGGGLASAITISALLISMAAGFAQARAQANAIASQTGQFYKGGYTGDGGKYDKAGDVHKGEFVFDQRKTKQWRPIFDQIHEGKLQPGALMEQLAMRRVGLKDAFGGQQVIVNTNQDAVVKAIQNMPGVNINMNAKGIISIQENYSKVQRKRNWMRRK